ncbi:MAG: PepSY-associated TM helix domain-containing protein [Vicinamibacterales bacterium]
MSWRWTRRALFQVHLWTGIVVGLYVVLISLTGSAVVFRREFGNYFMPRTVPAEGRRLTDDEIRSAAIRAYAGYEVTSVSAPRRAESPVSVTLVRGDDKKERRFNPYTGADMGDLMPRAVVAFEWVVDLHDNLLSGPTGRMVNGVGGLAIIVLALSGIVVWWRGIANWHRGLVVQRKGGWRRTTFDLHGALGFWSLAFLLMWAVTGVYFAFPEWLYAVVGVFEPETDENFGSRNGDDVIAWLVRMHFGRFGGLPVRVAWTVLGLIPAALAITGAMLWWSRVVRPLFHIAGDEPERARSRRRIADGVS